jgi:hypothetical protein
MAVPLIFAPGVNPSFVFEPSSEYPVDEGQAIKPYGQVRPLTLRAVRQLALNYLGLTRDQLDYIESFFHELRGSATAFFYTPPDAVPSPAHRGPDLSSATAGALDARTVYARFTWYDNVTGQESKPSPLASISLLASKVLVLTAPIFPSGVPAMRIYASTVQGSEVLQAFSLSRIWQEPPSGLLTLTSAPPSSNNLKPRIKWRLIGRVAPQKVSANRYNLRLDFGEQHI